MSSYISDENKSSSMTSESENREFWKKMKEFKYPPMPKRNPQLRKAFQVEGLTITTNLFEFKFGCNNFKFTLFSINILPEIDKDNDPLLRKLFNKTIHYLPKCFKKAFRAGQDLFAIIDQSVEKEYEYFEIKVELDDTSYNIIFKKVKEISFKNVNDFSGDKQKFKTIIENIFRDIVMKNPKVIKFHDRTLFEIDPNNITNIYNKNNFYSGYITSANITESGLYMLVNNINKLITGKTVLEKMRELRSKFKAENRNHSEIVQGIKDYFRYHRTVLTTYGSLRTYRINDINFDKNPSNTNINYKDKDGKTISIPLSNYYKIQYQLEIKNKNQPLIVAENNFNKNKNLLPSNDKNNSSQNYEIYLIPELVYITGFEEDKSDNSHKRIISHGIKNPNQKMSKIRGIFNLINSNNSKQIKNKKGEKVNLKSPKELSDEWGINLGSNLSFQGMVLPPPQLYFGNNKELNKNILTPKNGRFQTANPFTSNMITTKNIFFVYDRIDEKKFNHRQLFTSIMVIFREKNFQFSKDFHPDKILGYAIEDTSNWENTKRSLNKMKIDRETKFGIIFCNSKLEKYYNQLKEFFVKQNNISTQHVITSKLLDSRRGKTMKYNLVDQINVKTGGQNFYINFTNEKIFKEDQVFLIIGLDSKRSNKNITYSMTSSKNFELNKFYTQEETCLDKVQPKNETLTKMFKAAINKLITMAPQSPDYIIIYRQGGNDMQNKRLAVEELDNFLQVLKDFRENYKNKDELHNFTKSKLYYICCNLKSDLKFFEVHRDYKNNTIDYKNPVSGLIVDEKVTQSNRYEFYLQPQFVNQGTATPCHYQVMYYDKSPKEEDNLEIEKLQKLSFDLTFYYWTWSGAIRVPSLLKMSTTAMDFCKRVYGNESCSFEDPIFI